MWGELGHSYRKDNQIGNAISAYLKAIKIIDRDTLRGNIAIADKIFDYQYKLILTKIFPRIYSRDSFKLDSAKLVELLNSDTDPSALAALAHSLFMEGNIQLAKKALEKATIKCPIYQTHPDLRILAPK